MNKILSTILIILVPIVVVLLGVRLLLSPLFVQIEYRMPYFPDDPFGFTFEERLHWSNLSREYLLNNEDISFLEELEFDNGLPIYNERELRHMLDVKVVVRYAMITMYLGLATIFGVATWAFYTGRGGNFLAAIARGGWVTIGLIVFIVVMILISFNTFFVAFHRVFFEGDTWLFLYSDTLIRLFPEVFWRDAFLMIGGLALLIGLALALVLPRLTPRKE